MRTAHMRLPTPVARRATGVAAAAADDDKSVALTVLDASHSAVPAATVVVCVSNSTADSASASTGGCISANTAAHISTDLSFGSVGSTGLSIANDDEGMSALAKESTAGTLSSAPPHSVNPELCTAALVVLTVADNGCLARSFVINISKHDEFLEVSVAANSLAAESATAAFDALLPADWEEENGSIAPIDCNTPQAVGTSTNRPSK